MSIPQVHISASLPGALKNIPGLIQLVVNVVTGVLNIVNGLLNGLNNNGGTEEIAEPQFTLTDEALKFIFN